VPADLLLPLIALALLLNAVLVSVAVRQLVVDARISKLPRVPGRGRVPDPARARDAAWPPDPDWQPEHARPLEHARQAGSLPEHARRAGSLPEHARRAGSLPAPDRPRAAASGEVPATDPATDPLSDPFGDPGATAAPATQAPPPRRRPPSRTRRFTLPETEDRDRADRAIELFLSGGRVDSPPRPHPRVTPGAIAGAIAGERRAHADGRTASVAIMAIAGYRTLAADDQGRERADAVAEAVETTLRRSARSDDHVVFLGDGRFRILLIGTSEPAAQAYLERVRTACTPWLSVAGVPLDLVTAAAQAGPDGDLSRALRTAERRLGRAAGATDLVVTLDD